MHYLSYKTCKTCIVYHHFAVFFFSFFIGFYSSLPSPTVDTLSPSALCVCVSYHLHAHDMYMHFRTQNIAITHSLKLLSPAPLVFHQVPLMTLFQLQPTVSHVTVTWKQIHLIRLFTVDKVFCSAHHYLHITHLPELRFRSVFDGRFVTHLQSFY